MVNLKLMVMAPEMSKFPFFFFFFLGGGGVPYLEFFEQGGSTDIVSLISGGQR